MRTKEQIIELIREGKLGVTNNQGETKSVMPILKELGARIPSYMDGNDDSSLYYVDIHNEVTVIDLEEASDHNLEVITLQEYLDSPSLSEIPTHHFEGSREYDEKLLGEFTIYLYEEYGIAISSNTVHFYLNKRYNSDLLKEKDQLEQRLKEINEQLK